MSVTIQVPIPDDLLPVLERRARGAGLEREQYVSQVLFRELKGPPALDEVLAGFRGEVAASRISDEELDELFTVARDEAAAQRSI